MKRKPLVLLIIWLVVIFAGWHTLPYFYESKYHSLIGASGGGGWGGASGGGDTATVSLAPIAWVTDCVKAFKPNEKYQNPVLVFFTTEEGKSIPDKILLAQNTNDITSWVVYLMVVLELDKKDKDKDDLDCIKRLLKSRSSGKGKNRDTESAGPAEIKKGVELGAKYQVSSLPQLVWTDCYGNELQKSMISILATNTTSGLRQEIKTVIEKQKQLKESLDGQYKPLESEFKAAQQKGTFSKSLIGRLQKVALYDGYEPSNKARLNLEEINRVAGDELDKITADLSQKNEKEKQQIIADLKKFEDKYRGLPVTEKAKEIIESLAGNKSAK